MKKIKIHPIFWHVLIFWFARRRIAIVSASPYSGLIDFFYSPAYDFAIVDTITDTMAIWLAVGVSKPKNKLNSSIIMVMIGITL
jgi:hypothetical protein